MGWTTEGIATNTEPYGDIVVEANSIGTYAFAGKSAITSVVLLNATSHGQFPFQSCTGLTSLSAPQMTRNSNKFMLTGTQLKHVSFPKLTYIAADQFIESSGIENLVFPSFSGGVNGNSLRNNTLLAVVDFAGCTGIGSSAFSGCSRLNTIIIRGSTVPTLGNVNSFTNTPFASGGTGGVLYVPQAMISLYEAASGWSTLLGYANNEIVKIEGSQYDGYYADGTAISGVAT